MDAFRSAVHRHGLLRALRRSLLGRARKLIDFEICRVEITTGEPYLWPDVAGYDTRIVGEAEFQKQLPEELEQVRLRPWCREKTKPSVSCLKFVRFPRQRLKGAK